MWSTGSLTRPSYQNTQTLKELPPAGYSHGLLESAKQAMAWEERPETPQQLTPFKHYARQTPGTITKHFGTARDPVPSGTFGCKTKASSDSAADCIRCFPDSATARWQLSRREDIYASNRREPLGKAFTRGYNIPEGLGTEKPFGRALNSRDQEALNSTRNLIFPPTSSFVQPPQSDKEHELYVRTHGSFAAGEQRTRHYNWQQLGIDPNQHRFGWVDRQGNGLNMQQVLQPHLDPGSKLHTSVVSKVYEHHKLTQGEELGKPRRLGARMPPGPDNQDPVFGKASNRGSEPSAAELLKGWYTEEEQQPDADLGKSLHEGWRNTNPNSRAGGIPGVRLDIPAPANPSVANTMNYGNEPSAQQLLAPPACAELGVSTEDLLSLRGIEDLGRLMAAAGRPLSDEEIAAAVQLGAELDGLPGCEKCSLDAFLNARKKLMQQAAGL